MESQKISVIIPVYNTEKYLPRCLDSVLNNDYKNLEIICVNDGSPDNSIIILKEYQKKDDRIIILDVSNGGLSQARNLGLDIATGKYICFIDSDDWIHKQFFDVLLFFIKKTGADIAVCEFIRTEDIPFDKDIDKTGIIIHMFDNGYGFDNHTVKSHSWGRLISKSVIGDIRFQVGIQTAEDTLFNLDVYANKQNVKTVLIKSPLYYYYTRSGSIIHTDTGLDFMKFSFIFLDRSEKSGDKRSVEIFLNEAFKNTLSVRYSVMFEKDKTIKAEAKQLIKRCLKTESQKKPFSFKKSIMYRLFAYFPFTYRLFRIINDPTLIQWEKKQKREQNKKN